MNREGFIKKYGRRLVLTMSLIVLLALSAQVCFAVYTASYRVDITVNPASVYVNSPTTVTIHVFDMNHPNDYCSGANGALNIWDPNKNGTVKGITTNATGWYTMQYTPDKVGTYTFQAYVNWDYTKFGHPEIGLKSAMSQAVYLLVKQKMIFTSMVPIYLTSPTPQPSQQASPLAGTPSPGQPTETPSATDVPGNGNPPGPSTDNTAPVTSLNLTGTVNSNGEYAGEVLGNLTAVDNEGGSGVGVIQYSFNGTDWYTYSKPLSIVKEGTTFVYYRSSDNAGNTEAANVKAIEIANSTTSQPQAAKATPWESVGITAVTLIVTLALVLIARRPG